MSAENWIAIDWGTSHLRAWHMSPLGNVLDHRRSDKGMNDLKPDQFEKTLIELVQSWLSHSRTTQILACGMVGSRQGWVEANYLIVPCAPNGLFTLAPIKDSRISVNILPGIKQASPADVMRGEETQIAGLLATNKNFSGVVCLPGTHSKWAKVINGTIVEFQTFLTGELFALLSNQSVLRHSLDSSLWDEEAFLIAAKESQLQPQHFSAKLFALRAQSLIGDLSGVSASARLSGLLIGLELANCKSYMAEHTIKDNHVVIIGEPTLSKHYASALKIMSIKSVQENSEAMTLQGLTLAYQKVISSLEETPC